MCHSMSQVARFDLPPQPGQADDPRCPLHSLTRSTLHVEPEALEPDDLRRLYDAALDGLWDAVAHATVLAAADDGPVAEPTVSELLLAPSR